MSRYFSIESILSEEERVPVEFLTDGYRLGHLDASSGMKVNNLRLFAALRFAFSLRCDYKEASFSISF